MDAESQTPMTDDIVDYYERYWEDPESYNDATTPQRQALLSRHLADLPKGAAILDVGCGRGEFCAFFREMGLTPQGLDISEPVIEFARKEHPEIEFRAGEVQTVVDELAGSFDCVFSSEVIEHLFDVGKYLEAIHALLKPGGRFVLTTPYHGLIKNVMLDVFNYSGHYDPLGQHIRFFDRKGLDMCLREYGFEPQVWTGYGRPWPLWKSFFVVATRANSEQRTANSGS